jgi:hypothetical protein
MEKTPTYFVCKSLDADKKSKNIIAIMPKVLVNKFFLNTLSLEDHLFDAIVLEIQDDALPIISCQ